MTEIKDKLDVHSPTKYDGGQKGGRGGVQCPLNSDRNGGRREGRAKSHSVVGRGHICYREHNFVATQNCVNFIKSYMNHTVFKRLH